MAAVNLCDIMKEYKARYQYTNKDLANVFQVSVNTVNRWLRGEILSVQGDTADKISVILGYDILAVLHGQVVDLKKPIIGMKRAGYDLFIMQDYLGDAIVSYDEYKNGDYFIKVDNDDMKEAGIVENSLVYVKKVSSIGPDEIAVVVADDIAYLRYYKKESGYIVLSAANSDIDDMIYTNARAKKEHVAVIGKVLFSKNVY
ncbi:MAG: hypothetical protein LUG60_09155 [Erysipelotrichaceae bacterium]|nr:hypothetical protein [Erysipelotrichaceae bacterium]